MESEKGMKTIEWVFWVVLALILMYIAIQVGMTFLNESRSAADLLSVSNWV